MRWIYFSESILMCLLLKISYYFNDCLANIEKVDYYIANCRNHSLEKMCTFSGHVILDNWNIHHVTWKCLYLPYTRHSENKKFVFRVDKILLSHHVFEFARTTWQMSNVFYITKTFLEYFERNFPPKTRKRREAWNVTSKRKAM